MNRSLVFEPSLRPTGSDLMRLAFGSLLAAHCSRLSTGSYSWRVCSGVCIGVAVDQFHREAGKGARCMRESLTAAGGGSAGPLGQHFNVYREHESFAGCVCCAMRKALFIDVRFRLNSRNLVHIAEANCVDKGETHGSKVLDKMGCLSEDCSAVTQHCFS